MNNDLISRGALKKAIIEHRYDYVEDNFFWTKLFNIIDNAPTVEAEKTKESEIIKAYTKGFDTGVETVKNERPQSDIRWTDKLAVTSSGDIIDFEGRVVGHINLEDMIGGAE